MPQNLDFSIQVLVGGSPIPEYETDGRYYVESNLATPFSYRLSATEIVNGEEETQMWPVTPYQLCLCARTKTPEPCYYRILVDGVKVKGLSIAGGQARIIKGFRDGACIREFLFSMPRFAKDGNDRITDERKDYIGTIEVQCWNATLRKTKYGLKRNYLEFQQANKKDSVVVTNGDYTMATSKAGKVVCSRSLYRSVDNWKLTTMRNTIKIFYHMGHTLQSMGFTLRPYEYRKEALQKNSVVRLKKPGRSSIIKKDGGSSSEMAGSQSERSDADDDVEDVVVTAGDVENGKRKRKPTPTMIDLTEEEDQEPGVSKPVEEDSEEPLMKKVKTEIKAEKGSPKKSVKNKDEVETEKEAEEEQTADTEENEAEKSKAMETTDGEAAETAEEGSDKEPDRSSPAHTEGEEETEKSPSEEGKENQDEEETASRTGEGEEEKEKGEDEGDKDDERSQHSEKDGDAKGGGVEEPDSSLVNKESISMEVANLLKTLGIPVGKKDDEEEGDKENSEETSDKEQDKEETETEKARSSPDGSEKEKGDGDDDDARRETRNEDEEGGEQREPTGEEDEGEKELGNEGDEQENIEREPLEHDGEQGDEQGGDGEMEEPVGVDDESGEKGIKEEEQDKELRMETGEVDESELNKDDEEFEENVGEGKESEMDEDESEKVHESDMLGGELEEKTDDDLLNEDDGGETGGMEEEGMGDEEEEKLLAGDTEVAMDTDKDNVPEDEDEGVQRGMDTAAEHHDTPDTDMDAINREEQAEISQNKTASDDALAEDHLPEQSQTESAAADTPQTSGNGEPVEDTAGDPSSDNNIDNTSQNTTPKDESCA